MSFKFYNIMLELLVSMNRKLCVLYLSSRFRCLDYSFFLDSISVKRFISIVVAICCITVGKVVVTELMWMILLFSALAIMGLVCLFL